MQMTKKMDLKNSFIVSTIIHVIILVFIAIFSSIDPFKEIEEPIVVTLQFEADAMSEGNAQSDEKVVTKPESQPQKKTETKPEVKEKTAPKPDPKKEVKMQEMKSLIDKINNKDTKTEVKTPLELPVSDTAIKPEPKQDTTKNVDKQMDEFLEQKDGPKVQDNKLSQLDDDIEKILNDQSSENTSSKISDTDPLKGAEWSATPRKTLSFPDLASKIPEEYKKKGQNYTITVRIEFDKNGLAVRVITITSSGDPQIDAIFNTELRKIRVEPINRDRVDYIIKKFTISSK